METSTIGALLGDTLAYGTAPELLEGFEKLTFITACFGLSLSFWDMVPNELSI